MKNLLLVIGLSFGLITNAIAGPGHGHDHKVDKKMIHAMDLTKMDPIGNMEKVIRHDSWMFMTGQPDEATLATLKDHDFKLVINIRAANEIKFDEKAIVEKDGIAYYNVPLMKDGKIQDSAVTAIHEIIGKHKGEKMLFHCSSGNRVAGWYGAHMARDMGFDTETSVMLAKKAGMTKDSMEEILRAYIAELSK